MTPTPKNRSVYLSRMRDRVAVIGSLEEKAESISSTLTGAGILDKNEVAALLKSRIVDLNYTLIDDLADYLAGSIEGFGNDAGKTFDVHDFILWFTEEYEYEHDPALVAQSLLSGQYTAIQTAAGILRETLLVTSDEDAERAISAMLFKMKRREIKQSNEIDQ